MLLLMAAAAYGVYSLLNRSAPTPFENFTITQLTDNGKTIAAAISPDGKYLLSVLDDKGKQSLWLRNVATSSDTQVIPPSDAYYRSPIFSPTPISSISAKPPTAPTAASISIAHRSSAALRRW